MNKPRYLEYLLHMLTDEELALLCEARVIDASGSREEQIRRIVDEPTGKVYDRDYLQFLSEDTLQRICKKVGYPKVAEREGETLILYATHVFRDVQWTDYVTLPEPEPEPEPVTSMETLAAWRELEDLGQHTVEALSRDRETISLLSEWTNLPEATLLQKLHHANSDQILRIALSDVWPKLEADSMSSFEGLSGLSAQNISFAEPASDNTILHTIPQEVLSPELSDPPDPPDQPDQPETPEQPDAPDQPETPEQPDIPDIPKPAQPDVPERPGIPEPVQPEVPGKPEVPGSPDVPERPDEPRIPETPEQPEIPDPPEIPEQPEVPEQPETPDRPEIPEYPEVPEQPSYPDQPEIPEYPDVPEQPSYPDQPEIPEFSAQMEASAAPQASTSLWIDGGGLSLEETEEEEDDFLISQPEWTSQEILLAVVQPEPIKPAGVNGSAGPNAELDPVREPAPWPVPADGEGLWMEEASEPVPAPPSSAEMASVFASVPTLSSVLAKEEEKEEEEALDLEAPKDGASGTNGPSINKDAPLFPVLADDPEQALEPAVDFKPLFASVPTLSSVSAEMSEVEQTTASEPASMLGVEQTTASGPASMPEFGPALELELEMESAFQTLSDERKESLFQLQNELPVSADELPASIDEMDIDTFMVLSMEEEEEQDEAYWYLDDLMHEMYLWLRQRRSVRTYPRRGRREILLRYPALKNDRFILVLHFDGLNPIGAAVLEQTLEQYKTFEGHPITGFAIFAHAFSKRSWPRLQLHREWHNKVALFEVTPDNYEVHKHEKSLRPFGLLEQFLEKHQRQRTMREEVPDISGTSFVQSLHDAPTDRGATPFQSVAVRRSSSPSEPRLTTSLLQQRYEDLEEGQVLASRYELLSLQEETEVGKTFLAEDYREQLICTLKVIRPELTDNPEFQARFAQQFEEFCQASRHKNVVTYYDYAADFNTGLMYFTMEYVEGETLESLLQKTSDIPPLPLRQSLWILQTVARALTHIHNRGFVHRDIKPDNIILTPDGACKLMDFGIITNISSTHPRLYSSIWDNAEEPIPRASDLHSPSGDIYALGVLTYRLLTGRYPYPDDILPPSVYHDSFPYALNTIVLQALNRHPDERPSSAVMYIKEVREAILPLLPEPLPEEEIYTISEPPSLDSQQSLSAARPTSRSSRWKEFFVDLYSTFFRYSLTKQAIEQRRRRLRTFFLFLFLLTLTAVGWWWWPW